MSRMHHTNITKEILAASVSMIISEQSEDQTKSELHTSDMTRGISFIDIVGHR